MTWSNVVPVQRLFVYGTLAPGRPNEHVLADVPGQWVPATVRGHLVQHGWGAELGYPAITLAADGEDVEGMLLESDALDRNWERLDEFEGEGYERIGVTATRADATRVEAQIYVHRRS